MTLPHNQLLNSCQETVPIPILSGLRRVLAPFPIQTLSNSWTPSGSVGLLSHSTAYSLLPYAINTQTLCHPVGRRSHFRHAHSVDTLLSSLRSLLLVIITKHVLIIVFLFGTHLCLYILALGGARILTLCLHPKSSVRLKPLLLPHYLLYLLTLWPLTSPLPFATAIIPLLSVVCGFCHTCHTIMHLEHSKQRAKDTYSSFTNLHLC